MKIEDCIHYKDGMCIDGQECNVNTLNVKNKRCFTSRFALIDCKHYRDGKEQCDRCAVLVPDKYGLAQCSSLKLKKNGNRKFCTFYDRDEEFRRREIPLEEVDISSRTYNCLKRAGINTINDLEEYSESDLKRFRSFGQQCLYEVQEICNIYGITLKEE